MLVHAILVNQERNDTGGVAQLLGRAFDNLPYIPCRFDSVKSASDDNWTPWSDPQTMDCRCNLKYYWPVSDWLANAKIKLQRCRIPNSKCVLHSFCFVVFLQISRFTCMWKFENERKGKSYDLSMLLQREIINHQYIDYFNCQHGNKTSMKMERNTG